MKRFAAFLRGMNVGGRRVKNDELCAILDDLGMENAAAFLASGNLVFDAPRGSRVQVAARLERGFREALDYEVPTVLRTADEVRAIAASDVFAGERDAFGGKLQVTLLADKPSLAVRERVLGLATPDDLLAFGPSELYWLPRGNLLDSELDHKPIENELGLMTTRTHRTLVRLAAKYFD